MKTIITGAHILDPLNGVDTVCDLAIEDGRVAAVGAGLDRSGAELIDASGLHLFPGLIDVHVHLREPGQEYKETIATGTRAAAAGGFTAVAAMPNTNPVNDSASVTKYILGKASKEGVCRVYPVGAITKGSKGEDLADIGELAAAGCVAVTDDGHPVSSPLVMRRAMDYARGFGITVVSHCEDLALAAGGVMNEGEVSTLLGLPAIAAEAEESMVARDIMLASRTGAKLHLAHLSTKGSMELLRGARVAGLNVTGETAPHYFTLTDEEVKTFDAVYKMNPPLRTAQDLISVRSALASGVVSVIATDHAPHARDEKELEFEAAANGVIGLETSLGLALALYHEGIVPLKSIVAALTSGPAAALGLPGGNLALGAPADIVLVDLNEKWIVEPQNFQSKAVNCPFAGMTLKGRAVRTIVGGVTVYSDGKITVQNVEGAKQ
ncbi:MAG: dihydroorotase [Deltaproteobacteria bacterium]|nr:MAG: dihydroorotase [Deltaproteobacteria bacterium]